MRLRIISPLFLVLLLCGLTQSRREFFRLDLTWDEAIDYCAKQGMQMMVIRSPAKWQEIILELRQNHLIIDYTNVWLGIRREPMPKPWHWKYWQINETMNVAFWRKSEPDNATGDEFCVSMWVAQRGNPVRQGWVDSSCNQKANVYCEDM